MIEAILKRRSVRSYKNDPVSDETIEKLLKAAQCAPSATGNHAIEFIVIKTAETKKKIMEVLGQNFLVEAPVLILPVIPRDKSPEPVSDLAVATENLMLEAAAVGLGTVWKNIGKDKLSAVAGLLNTPKDCIFINIIPVGYPDEPVLPHLENELLPAIHREKW